MVGRIELLGESLDALPINVAVLDDDGRIVHTNQAWQAFGQHNDIQTAPDTVGDDYLAVCERSASETAQQTVRGLSELLDGQRERFALTYPCHSPIQQRWYRLLAVPVTVAETRYVVVAHVEITEQVLAERRLERRSDRLEALHGLDSAVRELTHAVIDQSARSEIEASVCRVLADTDAYSCVWLGEVDPRTDGIVPRATGGDCEGVVAVGTPVDAGGMRGYNVVRQAAWTRELQTTTTVEANPAFDWTQDSGVAAAYRSVAAVPICYEGALYSVLVVYTDRAEAFGADERAILSQLGEVVGHAIAAGERTRALLSDEQTEIDLLVPAYFPAGPGTHWHVEITQTVVGAGDDVYLYGHTAAEDLAVIETVADQLDEVHLTVIDPGGDSNSNGDGCRLVFRLRPPSLIPQLAAHGWSVVRAELRTGDCYLTVRLPAGGDVRQMIETISERYPETELFARRQVQPSSPTDRERTLTRGGDLSEVGDLTDRQRTVLEAAHAAGYFEWPRDTSGEEVADMLGISSPTFHQHLRIGQKKLLDAILTEQPVTS